MTTWTFKGLIAAVALLTLAACEEGQMAGLTAAKAKPLSQVNLAGGDVVLVVPRGFCIDSSAVRQSFALVARCDVLGAPQAAADAPLGFMTVSVLSAPGAALPSPEQTAAAHGLTRISDASTTEADVIFRADGPAPIEGVSGRHWRGTARIGGQIIVVALYGPTEGRAVSAEGRAIIEALIRRTRDGS